MKPGWALPVWTALWIVAFWVLDPAQTVRGTPPSWVLFEIWAGGAVVLGALRIGIVTVADSGRTHLHGRPLRTIPGAALVWTVLWMGLLAAWAMDPALAVGSEGPGFVRSTNLKPAEPLLYAGWLAGLALLGIAWLVARARRIRRDRLREPTLAIGD